MNDKTKSKVQQLSVMQIPMGTPTAQVFKYVRQERILIDAACEYAKKLREQDVEIFERKENVLATEKGYFAVLFDEEIRMEPGGIDNPVPFKGNDGRMKVEIVKEDGSKVIEDLANLVAKAFVSNFRLRKKVWFKDANPENCAAENLYYVPTWKYWFLKTFKIKKHGTVRVAKNRPGERINTTVADTRSVGRDSKVRFKR